MRERRIPEPGSQGGRYRYADTCANCAGPITGELIGILVDGDVISWRHRDGFTFGCDRRVDRLAPEAIPASDVDAACSVHGKVTRWHRCEAGGAFVWAGDPARQWVGGELRASGAFTVYAQCPNGESQVSGLTLTDAEHIADHLSAQGETVRVAPDACEGAA